MEESTRRGSDFGVDGFRIDTVKHVNLEFWQQFLPAHAGPRRVGRQVEVLRVRRGRRRSPTRSCRASRPRAAARRCSTSLPARRAQFAPRTRPTSCARCSASDDWYTDADSNAYQLPTFLGNHDMGHIGDVPARRQPRRDGVRAAQARPARPLPAVPLAWQSGRLLRRRAGLHRRGQRPGRAPGHVQKQGLRVQQPRRRRNRPAQRPEPQRWGQERQHRVRRHPGGGQLRPLASAVPNDRGAGAAAPDEPRARRRRTADALLVAGSRDLRLLAHRRPRAGRAPRGPEQLDLRQDGDDPHLLVADEVLPALGRRLLAAEERPRQDCRGHRPRALGRGLPRRAPAAAPQERSSDRADRRPAGERRARRSPPR